MVHIQIRIDLYTLPWQETKDTFKQGASSLGLYFTAPSERVSSHCEMLDAYLENWQLDNFGTHLRAH